MAERNRLPNATYAMTHAEIAAELGLTVHEVKMAEQTALRKLRHSAVMRRALTLATFKAKDSGGGTPNATPPPF